jgi:Ca2+-binding EF-hand superfamily protein
MPRDWSKPYTEAELENLKEVFSSMPSFEPGGWAKASDIPLLIQGMDYPRTPEQVKAYQEYWETHCGGIVTLEEFIQHASQLHETSKFAREYALRFDMDGNGYISADEFAALMSLMVEHDPRLPRKSYEEFVDDADKDEDGKVSIDECTRWIEENITT